MTAKPLDPKGQIASERERRRRRRETRVWGGPAGIGSGRRGQPCGGPNALRAGGKKAERLAAMESSRAFLSLKRPRRPHQEYADRISLNHAASTTLDEVWPPFLLKWPTPR
ncbi:hypothetical protein GW17_00021957 [Ensete ventricosum]|nr:hypothetical protein GW17_00021957 [Ensete ventricosum]